MSTSPFILDCTSIFLSAHWFIYPHFSWQGWGLQRQLRWWCCHLQLSLCAVWNSPYSWVYFGGIAWAPVSAVSEPSRLAAPCSSPFHAWTCGSSALPHPWLTHSPCVITGSKLHFFALSHLGPTGSSASLPHVWIHSCPPEPSSRSLLAHFPSQHSLSGFGVTCPTAGLP